MRPGLQLKLRPVASWFDQAEKAARGINEMHGNHQLSTQILRPLD
ncbi:hypothetical protein CEV34_4320 [Brucella pseudogrignonensis]|jgi:hypothetical protein|uniref:Uncharacterized protein n=1 Tax=Brucella pseudogrignonensis TaxID=419475 RepID=A0A256G611_9HYPH|nr:hypothetical protein CEV34_4320 [Brucella pseudogrignonensis]